MSIPQDSLEPWPKASEAAEEQPNVRRAITGLLGRVRALGN